MLHNLKTQNAKRAVMFEELARMSVRQSEKNNFVFTTRRFDSLEELSKKYRLDLANLSYDVLEFLNKNFHAIDMIGFGLDDTTSRKVNALNIFEVKTRLHTNKIKTNLCFNSFETYEWLNKKNVPVKLASFTLYDDWKYRFNIDDLDLKNFRKYTRYVAQ